MNKCIHVAACCDENYVAYATVMMLSALEAGTSEKIHFHLINCGIADTSLDKLRREVKNNHGLISIYNPDESKYEGLPTHRYGPAVYQRINLPDYIPSDIHKIIYLDSDTLVLGDLADLWHMDLEGHPMAAVENFSPTACIDVNLDRQEYFNSGVLLIDLDTWRQENIHHQVAEYAKYNASRLQYVDQCSLNAVLHKRWLRLPAEWNQQSDIHNVNTKYVKGCSYSKAEIERAMREPKIVHFIGTRKPWKIYCFHPFKSIYRSYLRKTPWAEVSASDDTLKTRLKLFFSFNRHCRYWWRKSRISVDLRNKAR